MFYEQPVRKYLFRHNFTILEFYFIGIYGNPHLIHSLNKDFNQIAPVSLFYKHNFKNVGEISEKIRNFYFGNKRIDNSTRYDVIDVSIVIFLILKAY